MSMIRAASLSALIALTASTATAQLRFADTDTLRLGSLAIGGRSEGVMRVVNAGTDTIAILRVHTDCGCTAASYPRTPIPPGDTADVTIRYTASDYSWGAFLNTVKLHTTSRDNPFITGIVTGRVRRPRHQR